MEKLFHKMVLLLFAVLVFTSCGTGPALDEKTGSDASVNVAAGAVDVDINTGFTLEFSVQAKTASVNSSTFFVVPRITATITTESIGIISKAAIDTAICNPANAIAGTITPSSAGSCVTTYTLNPESSLTYETEYALCVTSGVSFCNPNVNGFFSGLMEDFTTVAEDATYTVGGTVTGLSGTVILQNNAGDDLTLTENGEFTFATAITNGATYDVTVKTNPDSQTCTASTNSGTIDGANITNVVVTCSNNSYTVGGTVSGLSGTVVLQNNTADDLIISSNGSFTFDASVADGATYNVTVKTNPDTQTCTASTNSGTISGANVTNVTVTCSTNTYTIGGTVSGLTGTVVLQNNTTDDLSVNANGDFEFSTEVAHGSEYAVTVKTNPDEQVCVVASGTGTASANVTNVSVTCTTNTYSVGGTISGLDTGNSLTVTIQNNGGDDKTLNANDTFTFDTELESGDAYAVTISTQPDGETCHLSNASGTISGDVTNVTLYCAYFAYTANNSDNTVSIIDTTDRAVYATISSGVGTGPAGLGITPDGTGVYIGDRGESSVSLIDTAANTASTILTDLAGGVMGTSISPDGSTLYIDPGSTVKVYDITGASPSLSETVNVGSGPTFTALSPDGQYVYVPNYGSNNVSIIDTEDEYSVSTVNVGTQPHCACASPDGNYVYIVNIGTDNVSVIETSGHTVERTISVGDSPYTCAVTPDSGYVYVSNPGDDNVSVINTSTWASSAIAGITCVDSYGVDITHDGEYAYVACSGSDTVVVIQTSDNTQVGDAISVGDAPNMLKIQRPNPN